MSQYREFVLSGLAVSLTLFVVVRGYVLMSPEAMAVAISHIVQYIAAYL